MSENYNNKKHYLPVLSNNNTSLQLTYQYNVIKNKDDNILNQSGKNKGWTNKLMLNCKFSVAIEKREEKEEYEKQKKIIKPLNVRL